INMVMLSATYFGSAPAALTLWIPAAFVALCAFRSVKMMRMRTRMPSDDVIEKALQITVVLACILGVAIASWSLMLFTYGDAYMKGQVTFFIGITIITVMTCLRPLKQIASALFLVVVIPVFVVLVLQEHAVYRTIALNMTLVIGGMIVILQRSHSDFR